MARLGDLGTLQWLSREGCPIGITAWEAAADPTRGALTRQLVREGRSLWHNKGAPLARSALEIRAPHLHILRWIFAHELPRNDELSLALLFQAIQGKWIYPIDKRRPRRPRGEWP